MRTVPFQQAPRAPSLHLRSRVLADMFLVGLGSPIYAHVRMSLIKTNKNTMSRDFWYEFIQLYKSFPCLWDVKDPSYVRRDQKKEAYDVLVAKVHEIDTTANLDTVKRKIDSFRTAFRREEKKVIMSMHSGATDDEIYTPTLWYYRELEEFLGYNTEEQRNFIISRATFNNEDESEPMMTVEHYEEELSEESGEEKYTPPQKKRAKVTDRRTADPQPSRIFAQSIPVPQTSVLQNCVPIEAEDDCATFAANLKVQMRDIDKEQKFIAQKLISDVIFLARTNRLNFDSSVNSNLECKSVTVSKSSATVVTPDVLPNKSDSSIQIKSHEQ